MSQINRNLIASLPRPHILELRVETLPPLENPDYARLQVSYCGLCGSDLAFYLGRPGASYPRTLGHEYFGRIIEVGSQVTEFKVNQLVAVDPNYRCGQCLYCKSGASHLCDFSDANLFSPRGLSEFVDIHYSYLRSMPQFDPSFLGALIEPLSCALHAIELSGVVQSDRILILGCGSQGFMLTFALAELLPDLHLDLYDPHLQRAYNLAKTFGTNVRALTQPSIDSDYRLIFEASGRSLGFELACQALRKGGTITVISRYRDQRTVVLLDNFPRKEPTLIFSHLDGNGDTFLEAMNLLSAKWVQQYHQLINIQPLAELPEVLSKLESSPFNKTIIEINKS